MDRRGKKTTGRRATGGKSEDMNADLHELFLKVLASTYDAEKQLTAALPKLAKAAQDSEVREAFEQHLQETEGHVDRLEEVADNLGEKLEKTTCKIMQSIVKMGEEVAKELKNSSALDAALIAAAQKAEHYEIAAYGTLSAWAEEMGHNQAVELLDETLEEEKKADQTLTSIAQSTANQRAQAE